MIYLYIKVSTSYTIQDGFSPISSIYNKVDIKYT